MIFHWTGYGLYCYFKLRMNKFCIRFIPQFNKFSKDKRRLALWRVR